MSDDRDMKIITDSPSRDLKERSGNLNLSEEYNRQRENGNIALAKELGLEIARMLFASEGEFPDVGKEADSELKSQKRILLVFTGISSLELSCPNSATVYAAQNSFYSSLEKVNPSLYKNALSSGAFSFYYLAFRRGDDIERRIGQTFAMLCSHDGDPVYQELGEAIYCWFSSMVAEKTKLVNFK